MENIKLILEDLKGIVLRFVDWVTCTSNRLSKWHSVGLFLMVFVGMSWDLLGTLIYSMIRLDTQIQVWGTVEEIEGE